MSILDFADRVQWSIFLAYLTYTGMDLLGLVVKAWVDGKRTSP